MASKTLTYKSSNPQVAVVNSKGKVTAKKGGYSRIQISTTARSGKICTKDVDVFVYDGFDDVCSEHLEARQHLHLIQTGNPSQSILQVKQENNILIKWIASKQNLICWRMSKDLQTNVMV